MIVIRQQFGPIVLCITWEGDCFASSVNGPSCGYSSGGLSFSSRREKKKLERSTDAISLDKPKLQKGIILAVCHGKKIFMVTSIFIYYEEVHQIVVTMIIAIKAGK